MAKLIYYQDSGEKAVVIIGPENPHVEIGRGKECVIRTKNATVSRHHSQVVYTGKVYKLHDLGSSNGTFVQKKKITEYELKDNEVFFCGSFEIKFELEEHERGRKVTPLPMEVKEIVEKKPAKIKEIAETRAYMEEKRKAIPEEAEEIIILGEEEGIEEEIAPAEKEKEEIKSKDIIEFRDIETRVSQEVLKIKKEEEERINKLQMRINELENIVEKKNEDINILNIQIESLSKTLEALQKEKQPEESFQLQIAELEKILTLSEAEKEKLSEEYEKLKEKYDEVLKKLELAPSQTIIDELQKKIDALREEISEKEKIFEKEIEKAKSLKKEKEDELNNKIKEMEKNNEELKKKLDEFSKKNAEIEASLQEKDKKFAELEKGVVENLKKLREMEEEKEQGEKEIKALMEENLRWENLKTQFEKEKQENLLEIENLKDEIKKVLEENEQLKKASKEGENAREKLEGLLKEIEELKIANRSYLKKITKLLEDNEKLRTSAPVSMEVQSLKEEINLLNEKLKSLEKEKKDIEAKNERLTEKLKVLETSSSAPIFSSEAKELFQKINDQASIFKTNIEVMDGFINEAKSGSGPSEELFQTMGEVLEEIKLSAKAMKKNLLLFKKFVEEQ